MALVCTRRYAGGGAERGSVPLRLLPYNNPIAPLPLSPTASSPI